MNKTRPRYFAIVPAAGLSQRMGCPKLLLPWPAAPHDERKSERRSQRKSEREGSQTVIDSVLLAWTQSRVFQVVVVTRDSDIALQAACNAWPVRVVPVSPPPVDMKASVQCAVTHIAEAFQPSPADRCLMAPADIPGLSSEVIDRLIDAESAEETIGSSDEAIFVPSFSGTRGHPASIPWLKLQDVFSLAANEGVNAILSRSEVIEVPMPDVLAFGDVDTPQDYRQESGNS